MNKRGSLQDAVIIFGLLLTFSIVILLSFKLVDEFNDRVPDIPNIGNAPEASAASSELTNYFPSAFDNGFLILTIGLSISALILASLVKIHPIFIPFFIIVFIIVVFFSGLASNIFQTMAEDPQLSEQANQLTFISNIMEFLPIFIAVIGVLIMVVTYKIWSNNQ